MEQFDVIVVGGSVAGASTAIHLARNGHKVLALEKDRFPRDAHSIHFIWPRGMSYLNRLGVAEQVRAATPHFRDLEVNIEGIRLHGRVPLEALRRRFIDLHGDDAGVVDWYAGPRRFFLDKLLLDTAREAGADVREGTAVQSLVFEGERVVGVRATAPHGEAFEARAQMVVGADGRMSRLAGHVGAQKTVVRGQSTFAFHGYYSGIDKPELCIHKRGRFGMAIFPTMQERHLVLVYGPSAWWGDFSSAPEANFIRTCEWVAPDVAELVRNATRVEDFKSTGRMAAFHRECTGPGWMLVGNACSVKDHWTAMGITHGLRDAELASSYIDAVLQGEYERDSAMCAYQKVRMQDYGDYWSMVGDGAELAPYSREQLAFFESVSRDQAKVDTFMGQVGDTISLRTAIEAGAALEDMPPFLREFDPARLDYLPNPFIQEEPLAA